MNGFTMLYSPPFLLMSFANFFTVCSLGAFFLFPLFVKDHGGTEADIGIIMGTFALAAVLCRPWISEMIDRIGRKRSYSIGCAIMSSLPLAYLFFQGDLSRFYLPLLLVRIVHGVGLALCFTASFTYIADIVPEERLNEGIGMFGVTGLSGLAIGPFIGEMIIRGPGYPHFFLAAAALGSLGLLLHLPLPEPLAQASGASSQSFFTVLMREKTLTVAMLAFLFGFGLSASGGFVSPFAKEKGVAFISLYFICYSTAAVITRLLGGRIADRVGEERVIPYALVLTGSGLFMLIFLGGSLILGISGFISGCGHGFLFPCLNTLAIRNEPAHIRGKINGIFTGGIDGGAFVGPVMLGYIGEWAGFPALFFAAGLALLVGLGLYKLRTMGEKGWSEAK